VLQGGLNLRIKLVGSILLSIAILGCQSVANGLEKYEYSPNPEIQFKPFIVDLYEPEPEVFISPETLEIPTSRPKNNLKPEIKQVEVKPKSVVKSVVPKGTVKEYAYSRVGAKQFSCLDNLWTRESGWNYKAYNESSGAYGIPQALPGTKMASAGSDWKTNPITQVKWGLGYIKARYGNACGAWAHSQREGWY